jgi:hypothetical protein
VGKRWEKLWSVINPDWEDPILQSKLKMRVKSMRMDMDTDKDQIQIREVNGEGLPPTPPSRCDSLNKGEGESGGALNRLASLAASLPSSPSGGSTSSGKIKGKETHISPPPSPNPGSLSVRVRQEQTDLDRAARISEQPEEEEKDSTSHELFTRVYPWGKCYPLKPSHSDLMKVIRWIEGTVDEVSLDDSFNFNLVLCCVGFLGHFGAPTCAHICASLLSSMDPIVLVFY